MATRRDVLKGAGAWVLANTMLGGLAQGQNATTPRTPANAPAKAADGLRMGAAFTEDLAREFMAKKTALYSTREAWESDAPKIRAAMLRGMGLEPLPKRRPLNAIRKFKKERKGYTVENVAIETVPGYWLTGNLYLPARETAGPMPGMLVTYGHASQDPASHGLFRPDYQALCAAIARMGGAAFVYDMLGYGESSVPFAGHRSPEAMTIQTWDSIRALDWLGTVEKVDAERIGIIGQSGGGTQTFLLGAVDPRVALTVPVTQVSAYFFGGCPCESGRPIHSEMDTNNVIAAAMVAPKPQLVVSDGSDWTKNTPVVEFPFIKHIYELMGAGDKTENAHFPQGKHDINEEKRAVVYPFLAKHLKLDLAQVQGADGKVSESWLEPLAVDDLRVFTEANPRPAGAIAEPAKIVEAMRG